MLMIKQEMSIRAGALLFHLLTYKLINRQR